MIFVSTAAASRALPFQLVNAQTYPDGSIRRAELWFRAELPANGTQTFVLRPTTKPQPPAVTDLTLQRKGNVWEIGNSRTAIRLPAHNWTAEHSEQSAAELAQWLKVPEAEGALPGPLLGLRLASGNWTAATHIKATGTTFEGYETKILEQGPLLVRARITYRFQGGSYAMEIRMRQDDPFVRFDERYSKAGLLSCDVQTNFKPTQFVTKENFRGKMLTKPITLGKTANLLDLTGWDFYLGSITAVMALTNDEPGDLLGWISTTPDWYPEPSKQVLTLKTSTEPDLCISGSLENGHRHWGFLVAKKSEFPNGGNDVYGWWTRHIIVPLDKVINWQLVWPGMDAQAFPHTFFNKTDYPGIKARLQGEPVVKDFMEKLRISEGGYLGWAHLRGEATNSKDKNALPRFQAYYEKYRPRGGVIQGPSEMAASYLYSGDRVYLEQLNDKSGVGDWTPEGYLDYFIKCYLEGIGPFTDDHMGNMFVSDCLLLRYIGMEEVLGSGLLTPAEKRTFLSKLAFVTYVMHEAEWQPPIHLPDGTPPWGLILKGHPTRNIAPFPHEP